MCRIVFLFFVSISAVFGQIKFNLKEIKARFPNDEMAYLNFVEKINIDIKDGKPLIETVHSQDRVFLDERASIHAEDRIYFSETFQEIYNIKATSRVPKKTGEFDEIVVKDIKTERPSPGGGIFFDDVQVKKFAYPAAQKGGVGSLTYQERTKSPFMLSSFLFGNYRPIVNAEFSVTFDKNVKVSYKIFNPKKEIVFNKTEQNGKTTFSWKMQNIKAYPYENESLPLRYYTPEILLFIENYVVDNKTIDVLGNEQKLFNYYKTLVKDLNKNNDKNLIALTDSLTKGKSEVEKIKSVYYWVQDHIKYIAFEEGLGGFVPRQAADVCQKRYGDCKDMASLITAMLNHANVPAKMVWIGTRELPYTYAQNPSMGVDNHMIAAIKQGDEWQFLDATDSRIDYGLPTWHIQGKEGMIMTADNSFEIVKIPIVPARQSPKRDSMSISWKDRTLFGKGTMKMDGYAKTYVKLQLQYKSKPEQQEYNKAILGRGSNKCLVENIDLSDINAREKPLVYQYSFNVRDYVQQVGNEVFINPHLKKTWAESQFEPTRRTDYEFDFLWEETNIVAIEIPQGHEVSYMPKNASFSNPKFGFNISYEKQKDKILVKTQITLNALVIKTTDFTEWNKMVAALTDAYSEVISLKK